MFERTSAWPLWAGVYFYFMLGWATGRAVTLVHDVYVGEVSWFSIMADLLLALAIVFYYRVFCNSHPIKS